MSNVEASSNEEVIALDRLLTRLALTDDSKLGPVLRKLIPALIDQLRSPNVLVREKTVEILSHAGKRVRGNSEIDLPLEELVARCAPHMPLNVVSMSLVYASMGIMRCKDEVVRARLASELLCGLSTRNFGLASSMCNLYLNVVEDIPNLPSLGPGADELLRFTADRRDLKSFISFAIDVILYQPAILSSSRAGALEEQAQAQAQQIVMNGMSVRAMARVEDSKSKELLQDPRVLARRKLALLRLLDLGNSTWNSSCDVEVPEISFPCNVERTSVKVNGIGFSDVELHTVYFIAAHDNNNDVRSLGERLWRRLMDINVESDEVISPLISMFMGSSGSAETARTPVSPSLRVAIIERIFCKSAFAANAFPQALQVVFACFFTESAKGNGPPATKLRRAGAQFAVWMLSQISERNLDQAAPLLLQGLSKILKVDDNATFSEADFKSYAWSALGSLIHRRPALANRDASLARLVFNNASVETDSSVRVSLLECSSTISLAYVHCNSMVGDEIKLLLQEILRASQGAPNANARNLIFVIRWACTIFPYSDEVARYICCCCSSTEVDAQVRSNASKGLLPPSATSSNKDSGVDFKPPNFDDLVSIFSEKRPEVFGVKSSADIGELHAIARVFRYSFQYFAAGEAALRNNFSQRSRTSYLLLLESIVSCRASTAAVREFGMAAILELFRLDDARQITREYLGNQRGQALNLNSAPKLSWLLNVTLCDTDSGVRECASKCIAYLLSHTQCPRAIVKTFVEENLMKRYSGVNSVGSPFYESIGSMTVMGYCVASVQILNIDVDDEWDAFVASQCMHLLSILRDHSSHDNSVLFVVAEALGHCGLCRPLPVAECDKESLVALISEAMYVSATPTKLKLKPSEHEKRVECGVRCLGFLSSGDEGYFTCSSTDVSRTDILVEMIIDAGGSFSQRVENFSSMEGIDGEKPALTDRKVASASSSAIMIASGEALARCCGIETQTVETILHIAKCDTHESLGMSALTRRCSVERMESHDIRRANVMTNILRSCLFPRCSNSLSSTRARACIQLLTLLSFCGGSPGLHDFVDECQDAFTGLLGDEESGEYAAEGVSLIYKSCGADGKGRLVQSLVDSLVGGVEGKSRARQVKISGDSRLFHEGQVGVAPGGGKLTTYKELCSVATDLGSPELVYQFMSLANHNSQWAGALAAASGFALVAREARKVLEPHLGSLVPRLWRLMHDPDPRLRESVSGIWKAIASIDESLSTGEAERSLLTLHLGGILDLCIASATGAKQWRIRESSVMSLSDIIPGRSFEEVGDSRLRLLWEVASRSLDDIKETVRVAGHSFFRALSTFSLRVCGAVGDADGVKFGASYRKRRKRVVVEAGNRVAPSATASTSDDEAYSRQGALSVVLPLVLKLGISSNVAEIRALGMNVLVQLITRSPPLALSEHAAESASSLLEACSTMEDSRLSYIQNNASGFGIEGDKLEELRISAAGKSSVQEALSALVRAVVFSAMKGSLRSEGLCENPTSGSDALGRTVVRATHLLRNGVGLQTRVSSARFIGELALRAGEFMKPYSGKILRSFSLAILETKSTTERRVYAASAAQVAKFSTEASFHGYVVDTCLSSYMSTSSAEDTFMRSTGGILLRELGRLAGDRISQFKSEIIPICFIGIHDDNTSVREIWQDVWDECSGAQMSLVLSIYASECVDTILAALASPSYVAKGSACTAIQSLALVGIADVNLDTMSGSRGLLARSSPALSFSLVEKLLVLLPGRLWIGKRNIFAALKSIAICHNERHESTGDLIFSAGVLQRIFSEVERKNAAYATAACESCAEIIARCSAIAFRDLVTQFKFESTMKTLITTAQGSKPSDIDINGDQRLPTAYSNEGEKLVALAEGNEGRKLQNLARVSAAACLRAIFVRMNEVDVLGFKSGTLTAHAKVALEACLVIAKSLEISLGNRADGFASGLGIAESLLEAEPTMWNQIEELIFHTADLCVNSKNCSPLRLVSCRALEIIMRNAQGPLVGKSTKILRHICDSDLSPEVRTFARNACVGFSIERFCN